MKLGKKYVLEEGRKLTARSLHSLMRNNQNRCEEDYENALACVRQILLITHAITEDEWEYNELYFRNEFPYLGGQDYE